MDSQDVAYLLRKVVTFSASGWDVVVPSLVQLAVSLVDTAKPGEVMPPDLWVGMAVPADVPLVSPGCWAAAVGLHLLLKLFHRHKCVAWAW
jgi:hypothetical protein